MRNMLALFAVVILVSAGFSQTVDTINGEWLVTRDAYGNPLYHKMTLHLENGRVTGKFGRDKLEGTLNGSSLHFIARDEQNNTAEFVGEIQGNKITGKVVETDASNPDDKAENEMTAVPPELRAGPAQTHEFTPTVFYRQFSASNKPVLQIAPGDTVHTSTVDAGGADEHGVKRVLGGNPETGPLDVDRAGERIILPQTKNGSGRIVWLNDLASNVLDSIPRNGAKPIDRVFPPSDTVSPENVSVAFLRACRKIEIVDFRLHDLRHNTASWLRMSGADLQDVAELLGHRDLRMTKRYSHLSPAHLSAAVKRLDSVFGEAARLPADQRSLPYHKPLGQVCAGDDLRTCTNLRVKTPLVRLPSTTAGNASRGFRAVSRVKANGPG